MVEWVRRRGVVLVLTATVSLMAASCSALGVGGEQDSSTGPTLGNSAADDRAADDDDAEQGRSDDEADDPSSRPSIWTRADDAAMRPDQPNAVLSAAVAPGTQGRWTIVGSEFDYELNRSTPVVWEAEDPDGTNPWMRTDVDIGSGPEARMIGVTRGAGLDVAVGSRGRDRDQRPAVWTRDGAGDWVALDAAQFDGDAQEWLNAVATNPDGRGFLASGITVTVTNKRNPVLWRSDDGSTWARAESMPFADDGSDEVGGIAVSLDRSVITGWQDAGAEELAVAWWSDDGVAWTEAEIEIPTGVDDAYLGAVVWFGDRFVTVGGLASDGAYRPAAWTSDDGTSWELQPNRFEVNDDGRLSTAGLGAIGLTVAEDRLLATAFGSFLQHVWESTDGSNWTPVDNIWRVRRNGTAIDGLAGPNELVVVTTPEPDVLFHGDNWGQSEIRDETIPTPIDIPYVSDVAPTPDGWMAVGGLSSRFTTRDRTDKGTAWFSVDGLTWTEVDRLPNASLGSISTVAARGDRVVAAGTETVDSAIRNDRRGRSMLWELDGEWSDLSAPALIGEDRVGMTNIAVAGDAVVAGGWIFVGDNVDAMLVDSEAGLDRRVNIGNSGSGDERVEALCGRADGVAVAMISVVTQTGEPSVAAAARSADGVWSAAEFPERPADLDSVGVSACVHGADGFLAVGWSKAGANDDILLWRSDDGSVWDQVDGPTDIVGEANQWLTGVAATANGYILTGQDTSSGLVLPRLWYGTGDGWQGMAVVGDGDDSTVTMDSLEVAVKDEDIVVIGRKNGAERVYTTTVEQLVAELDANS